MDSRRFWKYSAVMVLVAVLEITLSSPLFAALGFEYSALMALALSLAAGLYIVNSPSSEIGGGWVVVFLKAAMLSLVPLVISILSIPFIPNCALLDGLVFYVEIAIPSALLGAGFGLAFARLISSRKLALWLFIAFWFTTLFFSLLPGYTNPQLFTYGWQYGYFPGLTWDESIELTNSYLFFRAENIVWLAILLYLPVTFHSRKSITSRFTPTVALLLLSQQLWMHQDGYHVTASHSFIRLWLNRSFKATPTCTIHYRDSSLTTDERQMIAQNVRWYLYDVRQRFQLGPSRPIDIYIYPSANAMTLIGTRTASISKPWLSELHIAKENLHSMKHELAHVLLREKGSWPFYASWSTGLTEGAAMAVEYEYDGIYTLDEHAANILRLGYANGVSSVMAFTGFASNASQKSYVLAGSFSRFLLANYGSERFTRVYSSLSFQKEYGKPLDSLEAEWKRWLLPLERPLTAEDSLHFRYYYDRSSIIFNPCLRRIGKLERKAEEAYRQKHYAAAEALYRDAVHEGGGLTPLVMESYMMLERDNLFGARTLLDTTHTPSIRKQLAALYNEKADLRVMTGEQGDALSYYDSAMHVKIGASSFTTGWIGTQLLHSSAAPWYARYVKSSYQRSDSLRTDALDSMFRSYGHGSRQIDIAMNELRFRASLREGRIREAADSDRFFVNVAGLDSLSSTDSLALAVFYRERVQYGQAPPAGPFCPVMYHRADQEILTEFDRRKAARY
jgi:hypothetical protein